MPTPKKHESAAIRQKTYRTRMAAATKSALKAKGFPPAPVIPTMPGTRRWSAMKEHAAALLGAVLSEMEDYMGERSEAWAESEKADEFQEDINQIEEACQQLETICEK
jgi:hypothetical protein